MTSRDFCYWLQGFFELNPSANVRELNETQTAIVRAHLALVFKHEIDPSAGPATHQAELNKIHSGGGGGGGPKSEPAFARPHDPFEPVFRC